MGLKKDINLKGDDYQWLGSMFYFGTLLVGLSPICLLSDPIQATLPGSIQPIDFYSASLSQSTLLSASSCGVWYLAVWPQRRITLVH